MRSKVDRLQLVALASFALSLAGCSKDRAEQPRTAAPPPAADPAPGARQAKPMATFVVELDARADEARPGASDGVEALERFMTEDKAYAIYRAESAEVLANYLDRAGISAKKVREVRDINSPTRGGGQAAQERPREGHKTFIIERKIAGVGSFPEEKKQAISKRANAAVTEIGDSIEWDHSYLTDEGTYCVYRATDEETIRKHGAITGAPVNKVSEVRRPVSPH